MAFSRSRASSVATVAVDPLERADRISCSTAVCAVPVSGCGVETTRPITLRVETCLPQSGFFPFLSSSSSFIHLSSFIFHFFFHFFFFLLCFFQLSLASVSLHFYTTPASSYLAHPGLARSAAPSSTRWVEQILRPPCAGGRDLFLSFFLVHTLHVHFKTCSSNSNSAVATSNACTLRQDSENVNAEPARTGTGGTGGTLQLKLRRVRRRRNRRHAACAAARARLCG